MSVILNYAFDCGYMEKKPKLKLDPFDKSRRVPREVTREEIELALRCSSPNLRDFLLVLYYTGMRFSEARHLQTKYINFETGELRLPATLTKTRRERLYYIPDELKTILKNRAIRAGEGFLFPSRSNPAEPMSESHRSFERMKKRTGLDFNLHDLRHSFVTRKIRAGMPAPLLGKLIGASKNILESVYLHPQFEDWKRFGGESEPTLFQ